MLQNLLSSKDNAGELHYSTSSLLKGSKKVSVSIFQYGPVSCILSAKYYIQLYTHIISLNIHLYIFTANKVLAACLMLLA